MEREEYFFEPFGYRMMIINNSIYRSFSSSAFHQNAIKREREWHVTSLVYY